MDRARNRICGFIFRGVGSGRLVHALGAPEGLCAVCSLSDCARDRIIGAAGSRHHLIAGPATRNISCRDLSRRRIATAFFVASNPDQAFNSSSVCQWCGICLSGRFNAEKTFDSVAMGFGCRGQMRAQEVVVARERKPDAPERATRPSGRMKPQVRENKSTPAVPTVEQMRMAGALAAERLNDRPLQETSVSGRGPVRRLLERESRTLPGLRSQ